MKLTTKQSHHVSVLSRYNAVNINKHNDQLIVSATHVDADQGSHCVFSAIFNDDGSTYTAFCNVDGKMQYSNIVDNDINKAFAEVLARWHSSVALELTNKEG